MEKYFVPDGVSLDAAKERVTHMAIGAHQDDLEIFAYHGIAQCYQSQQNWFAGVTVTDGGGSARTGAYQDFTDEAMKGVRHEEQNRAAAMGEYSFQAQLGYPSSKVKDASESGQLVEELQELIEACAPQTLYLHNPADKHDTHIAVLSRCLEALRNVPEERRPKTVLGCEVWRDLDWLGDDEKIALPVDAYPDLAKALVAVFESQVAGGKDYVRATLGRRYANATFFQSHHVDAAAGYTFAIDLTSLIADSRVSLETFVAERIARFRGDVIGRIQKYNT